MSIESVIPSNHLILHRPLLLLPSIFPSIRVFSNESTLCIRWPEYWSFSFNISPSNEHPGLISSRMDWLDLLAVQRTLKSLLQHHSSKASILRCSPFFTVQLSHPYMTTGKTIALTRQAFVGKVMSLLFNMLSRLVITFLPRSKRLLISWLQSPSAVILEPMQPSKTLCDPDFLTCPFLSPAVLHALGSLATLDCRPHGCKQLLSPPRLWWHGLSSLESLSLVYPFPENFSPSFRATSHCPFWLFNQDGTPEWLAYPSSLLLSYPLAYLLDSLAPKQEHLQGRFLPFHPCYPWRCIQLC